MSIDSDLLNQAKAAEGRVIDAEHDAEVARCDFHRAVRRLQLAGASLREIADALGLSHQRVHQIVKAAGGSRRWRKRAIGAGELRSCSFCGNRQKQVKTLVAGPGVFICEACVSRADAVLATGITATTPTATTPTATTPTGTIHQVGDEARTQRCSFCGKRRHDVAGMASSGIVRICAECLRLCHEIVDERLT